MKLRKKLLEESRLYIIIDKKACGRRSLIDMAPKLKGPYCVIAQLRDKHSDKGSILRDAVRLRKLFLNTKTIFIINDYLDIAKMADADGIHLGQCDSSIETARKILGDDKIIGISCHSLKQALVAQDKGADYISVGPIFSTPTKPEYKAVGLDLIKKCKEKIKSPFFVIGGINKNNINRVLSAGARRIAMCRAIGKSENVPSTIKYFSKILSKA